MHRKGRDKIRNLKQAAAHGEKPAGSEKAVCIAVSIQREDIVAVVGSVCDPGGGRVAGAGLHRPVIRNVLTFAHGLLKLVGRDADVAIGVEHADRDAAHEEQHERDAQQNTKLVFHGFRLLYR